MTINKDQARRIVPLVKMEIATQSRNYVNAMILRNRYQDIYNSIEDKESENAKIYLQKIDDYAKSMSFFEIDIENLEEIQKELETLEQSD